MSLLEMCFVILLGSWIMQLGDKEIDWNEMNSKVKDRISDKSSQSRGFSEQNGKFHSEKGHSREKVMQSLLRTGGNKAT